MMSDLTRLAGDMGTYIYLTVKIVCAVYILSPALVLPCSAVRQKVYGIGYTVGRA